MTPDDLPFARPGVLANDGERVQCGRCGRWYRHLGIHLRRRHGIAPADYRAAAGLNRNAPLASAACRERQRAAQSARLAAIRPDTNPVMAASAEQVAAWSAVPRREQMRREHGAAVRATAAAKPRPEGTRPKPAPKQPAEWLGPALDRLAEPRQDPEWSELQRARIGAGRSAHLTPEVVARIVALRGHARIAAVMREFRVGRATVRRLWGHDD